MIRDAQTIAEFLKGRCGQPFRHGIGKLLCRWNMKNTALSDGNLFPDKVNIKFNMFGATVVNRVVTEVDCGDIVAVEECCLVHRDVKLTE